VQPAWQIKLCKLDLGVSIINLFLINSYHHILLICDLNVTFLIIILFIYRNTVALRRLKFLRMLLKV